MIAKEKIVNIVKTIPQMPAAAVKVGRLIEDPDVSFKELASTIEYDPGLTSSVLRMANSVYFGASRTISSIQEGIVRLGTKVIFRLVVASAISPLSKKPVKGYDLPAGKLWEHSVAVALGADKIAEHKRIKTPDYTFTAALLHNIGKIVLGTFIEVDADKVKAIAYEGGVSFETAEEQVLGINHAEAGALLLDYWNLPAQIVDVVRYHHNPNAFSGEKLVVDLVHAADFLAMMNGYGMGVDGLNYKPCPEVLERLALDTIDMEKIISQLLQEINKFKALFEIR